MQGFKSLLARWQQPRAGTRPGQSGYCAAVRRPARPTFWGGQVWFPGCSMLSSVVGILVLLFRLRPALQRAAAQLLPSREPMLFVWIAAKNLPTTGAK